MNHIVKWLISVTVEEDHDYRDLSEERMTVSTKYLHTNSLTSSYNVCQWLAAGRWFSPDSSTNKTNSHDITEILLKVALNTITPFICQNKHWHSQLILWRCYFSSVRHNIWFWQFLPHFKVDLVKIIRSLTTEQNRICIGLKSIYKGMLPKQHIKYNRFGTLAIVYHYFFICEKVFNINRLTTDQCHGVVFGECRALCTISGSSWSCGSWIYNYLCNQCLSPLTLRVQIPLMARCTWYNIMW